MKFQKANSVVVYTALLQIAAVSVCLTLSRSAHAQQDVQESGLYIEPIDAEVFDRFGEPALSSQRVWRSMCGGTAALDTVALQEIAQAHQALSENVEQDEPAARAAQGGEFNISFNFSPSVPTSARDALEIAAAYIEGTFGDSVSMTIQIDWANLGGGILGATGSNESNLSYSSVRNNLQADMDLEDTIHNFLPAGNSVPVRYNESSSTITDETSTAITWGNLKAIGGSTSSTVASMTFNSTFPWDFEPSNGVSGSLWDFQSVVVHEIGHAMGFVSDVDDDCGGFSHDLAVLDLFRFRNTDGCCDYDPDNVAEFTSTPRIVDCNAPNDGHTFDSIAAEYRFEDGSPSQASHFRTSVAAIMDPNIGSGESFYPDFFKTPDLVVFDAIGWDYPPVIQILPLPFNDSFSSTNIDQTLWLGVDGANLNELGIAEPSPPYSLNLDGSGDGGDQLRSGFMDLSGLSDINLKYWFQLQGSGDAPEDGEDLLVEYLNSAGEWVEFNRHLASDGGLPTGYSSMSLALPAGAYHEGFRFRFRVLSFNPGSDDWFIDSVCLGSANQCDCQSSLECDDGVPCTVDDCVATFCLSAPDNSVCDDGVGCTNNVCDPQAGCTFDPDDGNCDDGVDCTDDFCDVVAGCQASANDANCNDGNECTVDTCDGFDDCQFTPIPDCSGVQGLVVTDATDGGAASLGLAVCNLYVQFGAADDNLLSCGFADITTDDPAGFFQVPPAMGGADTTPLQLFLDLFPQLIHDSYVAIGLHVVPLGEIDCASLDPDFNAAEFNCSNPPADCGRIAGGWFCNNPPGGQGLPDENRQVFVGQFTVNQGFAVSGNVSVFFNDGLDEFPFSFECAFASACPADLNSDNQVDASDLAILLGTWGPCGGCVADINGDDVVDASDLASLLGSWGPCP